MDAEHRTFPTTVVNLRERLAADPSGSGVRWTLDPVGDLNVNLVRLDPDAGVETHVNREVDVVLVVVDGSGRLELERTGHDLVPEVLACIPKGTERSIRAGSRGLSYLTMHRRRPPLDISGVRPSPR